MKVSIVGSGNVAEALAKACHRAKIDIAQICARNELRGRYLAEMVGTKWSGRIVEDADIYLIAVKDLAIGEAVKNFHIPQKAVVAHTAGAVSIDAIPVEYPNRAVFYPFQTFSKGIDVDFSEVPIFCEGTNPKTLNLVKTLAQKLSPFVYEASVETRCSIHLSGVFVNNFVNHMYSVAKGILQKNNVPFSVLVPLMKETLRKAIGSEDPDSMQTGPAVRGDLDTISRHLAMMDGDENLCNIYKSITQNICKRTSKKD